MLKLTDLGVSLGPRPILHGIDLSVSRGELVGLIGPNGAGKSTLIRSVFGLVPSVGEIAIDGRPARRLPLRERARLVALLPQEREIGWAISVEKLVALGRTPHTGFFAAAGAHDRAVVERAIRRMELDALRQRPVTELSGGEKARVLIARALAQDAPLLIADEPTAGLDPAHQIALMQSLADIAADGSAVIASLHDLGLAARWCTRLVLLDKGRIVADGPPGEVLTAERLRSVYGIEAHIEQTPQGLVLQPMAATRQG
nr:ABC transporter ATP-binding protein [Phyllobacterium sp. 21LDTY02-6]